MYDYLEIIGTAVGFVYLWLEYRASRYLWIASVVMPAIYLVVFYGAGLYADTAINIYYLLIALYGWIRWRQGSEGQGELPITRASAGVWIAMAVVYIVAQILFALLLMGLTDSDVPWFNALTSALSIVGMWMLARKYVEQWLVWFVVDILSAALYLYKGLEMTAVLYIVYAIIAIFGYRKWREMMTKQDAI